jgi:hypothetical protein
VLFVPKEARIAKIGFWNPELLSTTRLFSLSANAVLLWSIEGTIHLEKCNSWNDPRWRAGYGRTPKLLTGADRREWSRDKRHG